MPLSARRDRLTAELDAIADRLDPRVRGCLVAAIESDDVPGPGLDDRLAALVAGDAPLARSMLHELRPAEALYRATWTALAAGLPDRDAHRPPPLNRPRIHPLMAVVMVLAVAAFVMRRCG